MADYFSMSISNSVASSCWSRSRQSRPWQCPTRSRAQSCTVPGWGLRSLPEAAWGREWGRRNRCVETVAAEKRLQALQRRRRGRRLAGGLLSQLEPHCQQGHTVCPSSGCRSRCWRAPKGCRPPPWWSWDTVPVRSPRWPEQESIGQTGQILASQ